MKEKLAGIEKILFFLLLLLLPTQLGRHFWPEWSLVTGVRVDYLSPTFYLTDLLWIGLFLISKKEKVKIDFGVVLTLLLVGVNVLTAFRPEVAIYRWLRWGEVIWLAIYARRNKKDLITLLKMVVPVWVILEGLLGLGQIVNGGSLKGLFYWLGERNFSFTTIGIAQISVLGRGFVRAYGTFSHPNSMVGFLLVALVVWMRFRESTQRVWWWVVFWVGMIGVFLSGSRLGWLLGGVILITNFQFLITSEKQKIKRILGLTLLILGLGIAGLGVVSVNYRTGDFLGGWDSDGIAKRMSLNLAAVRMISERWWIGVGMGNFTVALPEFESGQNFYWSQPAHDIELLALSEIGVLGVMTMGWWLIQEGSGWRIKKNFGWLILLIILTTGLIDHYWWTLPQNMWMLGVVLALL